MSFLLVVPAMVIVFAHPTLIRCAPVKGQTVSVRPEQVQLWFSDVPAAGVSLISVKRGNDSVPMADTVIVKKDKSMYAKPVNPFAAGSYTVSWKTAGDDGHVLSGAFTFTFTPKSSTAR